jgi:hypothetical protein
MHRYSLCITFNTASSITHSLTFFILLCHNKTSPNKTSLIFYTPPQHSSCQYSIGLVVLVKEIALVLRQEVLGVFAVVGFITVHW